ncbi:MAG TPA: glycine--tRNA ligase [Candidatus Saccharimonadales bacterium]|nr:glycine--tRNA ligase [Candidatus Saccharimonadales bacterium]
MQKGSPDLMEKLVSLAKRRGFVFQGSEIYGGLNGTWDLGPLGTLLAKNIKEEWWRAVVQKRDDVVGLDSTILHHSKVWEASGHIKNFTDPLIECKNCHIRLRTDHLPENGKCPNCGKKEFTKAKDFNLMFKTSIGPLEESGEEVYLRPETAQGIFINFDNVMQSSRVKLPFGIAQIGKGFRNEITTGNFLFRVREFEMMELEYFVKPGTEKKWHQFWQKERLNWFINLGIKKENIKLVQLPKEDLAHYSKGTAELWYKWPFMGFGELEGIASRGDYDLKQHMKTSGKDLTYFDEEDKEKYLPYVIEPSVGVGRAFLAFFIDAYAEEETDGEVRTVLKFLPKLAPIKASVFPLVKDEKLQKIASEIYHELKENWMVTYDETSSIGRRYRRADEIGTPFGITVDFDSLKDKAVTVRDRDSMKQKRVKISELKNFFLEKLS